MENPAVLISGAGPSGLMMAAQLAMRKLSFRIIDENEDHTLQSRALVIHARSLEIFEQMGIAEEAVRQGKKARAVNLISSGRRKLRFNLEGIGAGLTDFPFLLILEQSKTEKILNDFLEKNGNKVERKTKLIDFSQQEQGIHATILRADGTKEMIQAGWLIGADGARSFVREHLNIRFEGKTYEQSLFVLDCEVNLQFPLDEMYLAFSDQTFAGFFPMADGRCRVISLVPPELEGKKELDFNDVAQDFAGRVKMDVVLANPGWISVYHSHHRTVTDFRKGRCFLCGDAAHIHSPVGAQGMNTGLQDAYNLAWKLALMIRNQAKEKLLDTYHAERIVIARNLVKSTDRAFNLVSNKNNSAKFIRLRVLPFALGIGVPFFNRIAFIRRLAFKAISEIGIHYRKSPLSKQDIHSKFPKAAPKPGDRTPYIKNEKNEFKPAVKTVLSGVKFHLLLFLGDRKYAEVEDMLKGIQRDYPDLLEIQEVLLSEQTKNMYSAFGITRCGYYLIRPDGYMAFRCNSLDFQDFMEYLNLYFIKSLPDSVAMK
jgi:2-polyprenyl-6-methoxyphenol hydroxylase-like FAD-dependent oxidoreductase